MNHNQYTQINLADWRQVGEGGNGKTYVNPARPDVILKVNNARLNTFYTVKHEYDVSKAVESLGLSTPKMYEMVREGETYATISERIKDKKSLSRICHDEPERTEARNSSPHLAIPNSSPTEKSRRFVLSKSPLL